MCIIISSINIKLESIYFLHNNKFNKNLFILSKTETVECCGYFILN